MSFEVLLLAVGLVFLSASIAFFIFEVYWEFRKQRKLERVVLDLFVSENGLASDWDDYMSSFRCKAGRVYRSKVDDASCSR